MPHDGPVQMIASTAKAIAQGQRGISRFFIDRPIFASVLSIVIVLAGGVAVFTLPIAQYPQITPPTIQVMCNYPGASAQVVAESVAAPIEQQVNGVEDMLYMTSNSTNDGSYNLTVTFKPGVNLNFAQVLVQNRVNLALPQLPDVVKQTGVTTRKRNPDILMIVSLFSPDGSRDNLYLSNYATIQLKDELARIDGVGDIFLFGQQDYSMRIWVDPERLAARDMTAGDVVAALREQNIQVASGQIGQPPSGSGQELQMTLATLGRLSEPEQFAEVILKTTAAGRQVRIKDIGRVELGARNQDIIARVDGLPTTSIAIFQLPDSNALDTADRIREKMEDLKKSFPPGIEYGAYYDTTPFVSESIREVFKTLGVAVVLVAIVVLAFLQNWRSSLIPLVAVPVAIVGTFAVMAAIGFSLNNLTLFGLVLAIGIVVDDAIVVVEAVEHHIEDGLSPRDATVKAMQQVSGPVVAVALVLSAVFVPCAFISGITGQFFRQFALTIAVSTVISAFNSLTLSPALAAILLQPKGARKDFFGRALDFAFGWFFRLFNAAFTRGTNAYTSMVRLALRGSVIVLLLYGGLLGVTYWEFGRLPTGYIPAQDKGYLLIPVQLPDAASLERTLEVVNHVEQIAHETKGVAHTISSSGQSFTLGAFGSNFGNLFVMLDDFHERTSPELYSEAIAANLRKRIAEEIPEASVLVLPPPAVSGLGSAGGFKFAVEDRGDLGLDELQKRADALILKANKTPGLTGLFTVFRANAPQLYVDVNRDQCFKMGVQLDDVFATLNVYLGSLYVNDFNKFGRTWQVVVQSDARFRNRVEEVKGLKVRNARGDMVPIGTLASVREINGPLILGRYNMWPAAAVIGNAAPGYSSGQAVSVLEGIAREELPPRTMGIEWTEITYIQLTSGNTAGLLFVLAVVLVFLVLAAQYESWSLPLAVILVVPMCLLGSLIGVAVTHSDINIFTQVGFVVLIGLASKNAILIVEFARAKRHEGEGIVEATLDACRLRLRPILMTSFAFILGVVPLLFATGAGAEMRRTLGTAVFSGMLGVTLFGIFLTPVFFYVIDRFSESALSLSPLLRWLNFASLQFLVVGPVRRIVRREQEQVNGRPTTDRASVSGTANGSTDPGDGRATASPQTTASPQANGGPVHDHPRNPEPSPAAPGTGKPRPSA
jgi:multidrug efflux pump